MARFPSELAPHEHRFEFYSRHRIRPKGSAWGPWIVLERCMVKIERGKMRLLCGSIRRKVVDP